MRSRRRGSMNEALRRFSSSRTRSRTAPCSSQTASRPSSRDRKMPSPRTSIAGSQSTVALWLSATGTSLSLPAGVTRWKPSSARTSRRRSARTTLSTRSASSEVTVGLRRLHQLDVTGAEVRVVGVVELRQERRPFLAQEVAGCRLDRRGLACLALLLVSHQALDVLRRDVVRLDQGLDHHVEHRGVLVDAQQGAEEVVCLDRERLLALASAREALGISIDECTSGK